MKALRIVEYLDSRGRSPFAGWFEGLDANAAAKITAALYQLGAGNWGNTKAVGGGIFERAWMMVRRSHSESHGHHLRARTENRLTSR